MRARGDGPPVRVLMVCLGNICRSPTAEAMLRLRAAEAGLAGRIEVDSAGTGDWHVGQAPDRRAILHGERRGLAMRGLRARQVARHDFERFDLVYAMDAANLAHLRALQPAGSPARLALLLDELGQGAGREVPDPYFGGPEGFEQVLDLVDAACGALLARLAAAPQGRG